MTRWQWTTGRAVLALAGAQALVHTLLSFMAPSAGSAVTAHRGHTMTDLTELAGLTRVGGGVGGRGGSGLGHVAASAAVLSDAGIGSMLTMIAAHALMTVISAVVIARGESLLWAVLARLLPERTRPAGLPPLVCVAGSSATIRPLPRLRRGPLPGRGPPWPADATV